MYTWQSTVSTGEKAKGEVNRYKGTKAQRYGHATVVHAWGFRYH
jgi:hypothetical protein